MPDERVEQFRALMLHTMALVKEMRKDTEKLQVHVLALEMFLLSVNPDIRSQLGVCRE